MGTNSLIILCFHKLYAMIIAALFGFTIAYDELFPVQRIITLFVAVALCLVTGYVKDWIKGKLLKKNNIVKVEK